MDLLFGEPVAKLSGNEFLPKQGYTFAQQVEEYFKQQGSRANSPFGEVILDMNGVQSSKQHGMSRIKAAAFAAVKDVLENGKEILKMDYYGTNDKKQPTGMVAAPILIGNEKYICVVEVIGNLKDQRLYVHEAFVGKTLQGIVASSLVHGSSTTSPQPQGEIAKVLHNYLKNYSDLSFLTKNGSYSALRDRINAERNKDNGWGNASQAEINWWKNKNIGENKKLNTRQNMNRKMIRLTEADLHRIVKESVNRVLNETIQPQLVDNLKEMIGAMLNRCYKHPHGGGTILQSDIDEIYQMAKQLYSSMKTRETYEILMNIEEMANNGSIGSGKLVKIYDMLGAI